MNMKFMTHWPDTGQPTWFMEKIAASFGERSDHAPKIHTIRSGINWNRGDKIHFQIWEGRPYKSKVIQFRPVSLVAGIQTLFVSDCEILIDGVAPNNEELMLLAMNDGFDSVTDFLKYFRGRYDKDGEFFGQIIHWTDYRY